ncbi:AraC family transcriptional regulator [Labilibacter marinus]|uniref:AraC family transcriptional regulator n=1 Tax=Labilibacter marinus TaxID=1477105 RepID=UPI00094F5977|nr:AraC family transcriptional regulator [Labilibacter marinus]
MEPIKVNRKIELNKKFKISRMKEVIKPTVPHKHEGYFEIIYLTDGAGVHIIDENNYSVEPPMLFYMSPGHVHCWEFSKIPKGYVCIFKEEFLSDFADVKLKLSELATKYKLINQPVNFNQEFQLMMEEYQRPQPNVNILKSYLNIILWKIAELPVDRGIKQIDIHPTILNYRKLIDSHYLSEKTLDFYSDKLLLSKRSLNNICKKETGRSASSLINERIIVESKRLLKHTNNSISEIAYHLSFNDPSHFVKFFKTKSNLTPGEFRDKLK